MMKLEEFNAGIYRKKYQYESFSPNPINQEWTWDDPQINTLLEEATKTLSELNAFSLLIPNVDLFIQMHVSKEAMTSSRIEGTRTQMDEVMLEAKYVPPENYPDWQEVQNYIQSMNEAIQHFKKLPLSNRLLKKTHKTLMQSVRGKHKSPGDFRTSQNWIGGTSLQDAVFIPPTSDEVGEIMSDLEKFWHNDTIQVPHLIRIAISHYQFETIHPFLDGNGRIGRLLITLYLMHTGFLDQPSLYLSDYLERNRSAYFDALMTARTSHHIVHWIKFFLKAVIETAKKGKFTFQNILKIKRDVEDKIVTLGRRAEKGKRLLNFLYERPIINAAKTSEVLGITATSANALLKDFEKLGILRNMTGYQKRNRMFIFHDYFDAFQ